jgi:hypothetical protein
VVTLFFLWRRWVTEAAVCFFFTPIFPILFTKGPSSLAFRLPSPRVSPVSLAGRVPRGRGPHSERLSRNGLPEALSGYFPSALPYQTPIFGGVSKGGGRRMAVYPA